jgi:hypothetical protein
VTKKRIKELRRELKLERISYGELLEIQTAADDAGIVVSVLASDILDALEEHTDGK